MSTDNTDFIIDEITTEKPTTGVYVHFDEETIDKMLENEDIAQLHLRAAKRAFMRLDGRMKPLEKNDNR